MVEIVLELADRRLVLRNLLVVSEQLRLELAFALLEIILLERQVRAFGSASQWRIEVAVIELRLGPGNLRLEARDLRFSGADIGSGEGRVEGCQKLIAADAFAFLRV